MNIKNVSYVAFALLIVFVCNKSFGAETLKFPRKTTQTNYTVNLATGATFDEKSKDVRIPTPITLTTEMEDNKKIIVFTLKPSKLVKDNDQSEVEVIKIPYEQKKDLIKILQELNKLANTSIMKKEIEPSEIYNYEDTIVIKFFPPAKSKKWFAELSIGESTYIVQEIHTDALVKSLNKI